MTKSARQCAASAKPQPDLSDPLHMSEITRIDTITLEGMLPQVFAAESIPPSDVWNCHLEFHRGVSYRVEASSGAGKSSMCAYIFGSRTDFEGRLLFDGEDASRLTMSDWLSLRRRNIAYLPQELALFPELTAMENIRLKNSLTDEIPEDQIVRWLHDLGIATRKDTPAGKMSVGQQQRIGIIRALCQPFDFLLLDEPVSHLDETNNRIAADIISSEVSRRGASVISTSVGNPLMLEGCVNLRL